MRFFLASALIALASAAPSKRSGSIIEPASGTTVSSGTSIQYSYVDQNWCEEGYTPITIWLSESAPTAVNSTGQLSPGTYIEYYGQYLINNFGLPVMQPVPPASLTIPDISAYGAGSSLFLTTVETALFGTCPGGVSQPAQYRFTSVSLTVA
ncbi:hypothetical protein FB45DRAFT_1054202 [Roridomyces roridus]|uniref:Uncharacterized protein n=1 Tax=Roridomyces roridus TaxID=1738132 RepID=A0AAD7C856_9AGAR|nr:hypothetical protein FB45DRAFT_1054202 [Roridomyces roridus]